MLAAVKSGAPTMVTVPAVAEVPERELPEDLEQRMTQFAKG